MALGVSSGDTGHTAMTPGYSLGDILGGGVELGETLGISVEMSLGESLGIAGTESPEMTFGESVGMMGVRRGDAVGMALGVSLGWRFTRHRHVTGRFTRRDCGRRILAGRDSWDFSRTVAGKRTGRWEKHQ